MENFKITINKSYVYDEVAKTTSYVGAKMMTEDSGAYKRIFTTDDDRMMLERFWSESCSIMTDNLKPFIESVSSHPVSHSIDLSNNYEVTLNLSSSFDSSLKDSVSLSMFSFFVNTIVAKWCEITNRTDAVLYAGAASTSLHDIIVKMYYRRKPTRKIPQNE